MHQIRLFFIALQFFTRLPIPGWVGFEASWLQHASRYFPLVGGVVAAIAAGVYYAAALVLPAPVAAVLSTAASIYITGAFHEDGFADMCDGLGGGMTVPYFGSLIMDRTEPDIRGRALGLMYTMIFLGELANPMIITPLHMVFDIQRAFIIIGVLTALGAVYAQLRAAPNAAAAVSK